MKKMKRLHAALTLLLLAIVAVILYCIEANASSYVLRIARLCAINMVLALSMNLINGFTGLFSLGHAGFMAIGAYTTALLTIPAAKKQVLFMIQPLISPLDRLTLPFGVTLIIGGLLLGFVEIMLVAAFPALSGYRDAFAFVLLIVVLLVKPTGLMGEKTTEKV